MLESNNMNLMNRLWPKGEGKAVIVVGASGGILTWWDKSFFKSKSYIENQNWLFVELEDLDKKDTFWFGNVYGPMLHGNKGEFWNSLESQREGKSLA